jgi:hypothetical protein
MKRLIGRLGAVLLSGILAASFASAQLATLGAGKGVVAAGGGVTPPSLSCRTLVNTGGANSAADTQFTPTAGHMVLAMASFTATSNSGQTGADITVTRAEGGLSFANVLGTSAGANWSQGIRVAYAIADGNPVTVTSTISGAAVRRMVLQVCTVSSFNASTPIGGKGTGADTDGDGAASVTLDATPASTSIVFGLTAATAGSGTITVAPSTGWTELYDFSEASWSNAFGQYRTGHTSTTVPFDDLIENSSGAGGYDTALAGFEIRGAP